MDVDDGVGLGQQARGFWRGLGAEVEQDSEDAEQEDGDEQGNQRAFAHEPSRLWVGRSRGVRR